MGEQKNFWNYSASHNVYCKATYGRTMYLAAAHLVAQYTKPIPHDLTINRGNKLPQNRGVFIFERGRSRVRGLAGK